MVTSFKPFATVVGSRAEVYEEEDEVRYLATDINQCRLMQEHTDKPQLRFFMYVALSEEGDEHRRQFRPRASVLAKQENKTGTRRSHIVLYKQQRVPGTGAAHMISSLGEAVSAQATPPRTKAHSRQFNRKHRAQTRT